MAQNDVRRSLLVVAVGLLAAGCSRDAETPPQQLQKSTSALTTTRELSLKLPRDARLHETVLSAQNAVRIGNEAQLLRQPTGFASLGNAGFQGVDIGVDARIGTVRSRGNVSLKNGALVTGDVITEGTVAAGAGAAVTGTTQTAATLTPLSTFAWTIEFTDSTVDVVVSKGSDRSLPPGAYRSVRVQPDATLRLTGGTYNFGALRVEPKAHVVADTTAGPLFAMSTVRST